MSGPPPETSGGNEDTPSRMREQIEGHLSALKALVEEHNRGEKVQPIRLNFTEDDISNDRTVGGIVTGARVSDEDLGKPFKEISNSPCPAGSSSSQPRSIRCHLTLNSMTGHRIRRIISPGSPEPRCRDVGPCQCGVVCSSRHWMGVLEDGTTSSPPAVSMNGRTFVTSSRPVLLFGKDASKTLQKLPKSLGIPMSLFLNLKRGGPRKQVSFKVCRR